MRASLVILASLLGLRLWNIGIADPDLSWHLLGGAWTATTGQVPSYDFINFFNSQWRDYHWLAQVIFYFVNSLFGYPGLMILTAIIMAHTFTIFVEIIEISAPRKKSLLVNTLLLIISCLMVSHVYSVRPQMIALWGLAVATHILLKKSNFEFTKLVLLGCFLVNVHIYWVFIPLLWVLHRVIPALLLKRERQLLNSRLTKGVILALIGFVSPYGIQNYQLVYEYLTIDPYFRDTIREFQSPFLVRGTLTWVLVACFIFLSRVISLRRGLARIQLSAPAILGAILAFSAAKFLSLFVVFALPFLSNQLNLRLNRFAPRLIRLEQKVSLVLVVCLITISTVFISVNNPWALGAKWEEELSTGYPISACQHLARIASSEKVQVRVLAHFNYGAWCRYTVFQSRPGLDLRVSTDGRTQDADPKKVKLSGELFSGQGEWRNTLQEWAPNYVIVSKQHALSQLLGLSGGWKSEYEDKNFSLFSRDLK